ncbi:MAG: carbonic anhydrase [Bacteroidetes bacterium]|nr:carbonic anhydrase [Bacteroidota bacterium]
MKKIALLYSIIALWAVFQVITCNGQGARQISPDVALKWLKEGNKRFMEGHSARPRQDSSRLHEVAKGQNPFATIIGCSDSRVPNGIIFDQGLGDLFIVRTAGQVSTYASWGSIEFGEEILGTKLIVVLGHTHCGAVSAAVNLPEVPGHIVTLINAIKPAVEKAKKNNPEHLLDESIRENVRMQVEQLKSLEPLLSKRVKENSIRIIGAVYHLSTGQVEFLE